MEDKKEEMIQRNSIGGGIDDNVNSLTAGEYGPLLIQDFNLIDKLAHFDRERIPERVVHAKGSGAHGYFETTHSVEQYCKAGLFQGIGKKTPVLIRFSTVGGEKGSADTERDPRGFAVKFYTEEGNWDMTGNNTPVFFIRDPSKFPDFIHTQKRNPQTNLKDPNMMWDYLSLNAESAHQVTILFSDRGTPDGYRHMNGYGSHTFVWVNSRNQRFFVKWHFKTQQGIKNLSAQQADQLKGQDPDYAQRDLFTSIQKGEEAVWLFQVQVMPEKEAQNYKWNVLDITKVWPHKDYPLIDVGRLVLNRNPENYYQDIEQVAFSPGHFVPGIEPSLDRMLQGRLFSYPDTHRHRLGGLYEQIPVNCPFRTRVVNGFRDGPMRVDGNQGSRPNYNPNSFSPLVNKSEHSQSSFPVSGLVQRYIPNHPNSDFEQPGQLFQIVMNDQQKSNLIQNVTNALNGVNRDIQERQIKIFHKCHPLYADTIAKNIGFPVQKSKL